MSKPRLNQIQQLYPTVGAGGQYATMGAAITAAVYEVAQITDVVEVGDSTLPVSQNFTVHANGFSLDLDGNTITASGPAVVKLNEMSELILGDPSPAAAAFLLAATTKLDLRGVTKFTVETDAAISNSGIILVSKSDFTLPNSPDCGFKTPQQGSRITKFTTSGGDALTSGFITNGAEIILSKGLFRGTYNTNAANPLVSILSSDGATLSDLEPSSGGAPYISMTGDEHHMSNIRGFSCDLTASTDATISDCKFNFLDMTDTGCSSNIFNGVTVTQNVTIAGNSNRGCTTGFAGDLTITGDSNLFLLSEVVGTYSTTGSDNQVTNKANFGVVNPNNQIGTTYTLTATDIGNLTKLTNAGAITLTFPKTSTEDIEIGSSFPIEQGGAGQITCVVESPETLVSADGLVKSRTQYVGLTAVKQTATEWWLVGDMTA